MFNGYVENTTPELIGQKYTGDIMVIVSTLI